MPLIVSLIGTFWENFKGSNSEKTTNTALELFYLQLLSSCAYFNIIHNLCCNSNNQVFVTYHEPQEMIVCN